mgnify:CR=1 FL=1
MKGPSSPVYRLRSDVRFRRIEDEGIVLVQGNNEVLGVSAVGIRLLELIDGGTGLDRIVGVLQDELDVERSRLEEDVDRFVSDLSAAGVLLEEDR